MHRDAHLSYKIYKIEKTLFQWPSKVHKYQYTQNTQCFCIFLIFQFFLKFFYEKQNKAKLKTNKQKNVKQSKA